MSKAVETGTVVNPEAIKKVAEQNLEQDQYDKMLKMFKAISDETRLRILWILEHETLCVGDIAIAMNMTKSAVSHQLKYLKNTDIVKSKKVGKNVFYEIKDDCIRDIVNIALHHISEK